MKVDNLRELLIDELRDLYSAETQLSKALPNLAKHCTGSQLKQAVEHHQKETENQVKRLEQIFQRMNQNPKGKTSESMKGLIEEISVRVNDGGNPQTVDAGIVANAQRIVHHNISAYGTARSFANQLREPEAVRLLEESLKEEKNADATLNRIAESTNQEAKAA